LPCADCHLATACGRYNNEGGESHVA
jgi:hypothetical protein